MSRAQDDRKNDRREAARRDREEKDRGSDFSQKHGYLVGPSVLEELGIGSFYPAADKDGGEVIVKLHFLPFHPSDPNLIAFKLYGHTNVGPDNEMYLCPKWMKKYLESLDLSVPDGIADGRCPICERHDELLADYKQRKDEVSEQERDTLYKAIRAVVPYSSSYRNPKAKRMLAWVVDATDRDSEDEGVKAYVMPTTSVYEDGLLDLTEDDEGVFTDLLDPDGGFRVSFKRKGKGLETDYIGFRARPRGFSIAKDEPDWLDAVPQLMSVLAFSSYDEIAEVFSGVPETSNDDDKKAEGERGGRRGRAPARGEDEPRNRRRGSQDGDKEEAKAGARHSSRERRPARGRGQREEEDDATEKQHAGRSASSDRSPEESGDDEPTGDNLRDRLRRKREELKKDRGDEPEDRRED